MPKRRAAIEFGNGLNRLGISPKPIMRSLLGKSQQYSLEHGRVYKKIYFVCKQVKVEASFRSPLVVSFGPAFSSLPYYCIKIF